MDDRLADNRANWDDRVPIHWGGYDAEGFIDDPGRISDVVRYDSAVLGDVSGQRLVHLQCHFGMDTLSWARLGAEVTGVDFSESAIAAAKELSDRSTTQGRFVVANVYDAADVLGEQYDIVYTGVGAICWIPDIATWARVVAALLEPGGTFYMREAHPVLWALDWRDDGQLMLVYPYFEIPDSVQEDLNTTYLGEGTIEHTTTHSWNHGIAETFAALVDAGLVITTLQEHRELEWQAMPTMTLGDDGRWRLPEHQRELAPLMWTIIATKPR
ncbi:MAG: class I SAM-dependent methyltransferase [Acidimicrobiia bacterium]